MFNTQEVYNIHFGVNNLSCSCSQTLGVLDWSTGVFAEHYASSTITNQGQLAIHFYGYVPNMNGHSYRLLTVKSLLSVMSGISILRVLFLSRIVPYPLLLILLPQFPFLLLENQR